MSESFGVGYHGDVQKPLRRLACLVPNHESTTYFTNIKHLESVETLHVTCHTVLDDSLALCGARGNEDHFAIRR